MSFIRPTLRAVNDLARPDALTPLLYARRDDNGIAQAQPLDCSAYELAVLRAPLDQRHSGVWECDREHQAREPRSASDIYDLLRCLDALEL